MEQSHNSSRAKLFTYNNQTFCISEWARKINISQAALSARLLRGWSIEKALLTPPQKRGAK